MTAPTSGTTLATTARYTTMRDSTYEDSMSAKSSRKRNLERAVDKPNRTRLVTFYSDSIRLGGVRSLLVKTKEVRSEK